MGHLFLRWRSRSQGDFCKKKIKKIWQNLSFLRQLLKNFQFLQMFEIFCKMLHLLRFVIPGRALSSIPTSSKSSENETRRFERSADTDFPNWTEMPYTRCDQTQRKGKIACRKSATLNQTENPHEQRAAYWKSNFYKKKVSIKNLRWIPQVMRTPWITALQVLRMGNFYIGKSVINRNEIFDIFEIFEFW